MYEPVELRSSVMRYMYCLKSITGPIQGNQKYRLGATLGPFKTIGNMSQEQCWANLRPSAACLRKNAGPI
jgi:hypothetical protein